MDKEPFSDFWRRMGKSHKAGKSLGRWGLGKLVFSSSSEARIFFGLTVRKTDPELSLLMGQPVILPGCPSTTDAGRAERILCRRSGNRCLRRTYRIISTMRSATPSTCSYARR